MAQARVVKVLGVELHSPNGNVHELRIGKLYVFLFDPKGTRGHAIGKIDYDGKELFGIEPRHLAVAIKAVERKLTELRDLFTVFK